MTVAVGMGMPVWVCLHVRMWVCIHNVGLRDGLVAEFAVQPEEALRSRRRLCIGIRICIGGRHRLHLQRRRGTRANAGRRKRQRRKERGEVREVVRLLVHHLHMLAGVHSRCERRSRCSNSNS